ncbi:major capsid protein [Sigmofec virus UA08Rod_7365]|uniref:Major capsid protein n=1 Tax=Sigmofec virus UA08Rod_7365 TaxID=2929245 RepID=A0A976R744_9VIRU|nr:major capsid protein [Sigmofec virus UA08Rod_7365]
MARNKGRMTYDCTATINMGLNYPCNVIECFPGDSFRLEMKALLRFLPQVSPTMSNVVATVDTYTVPLRQLCEKIGLDWDSYLTGGEDGNQMLGTPMITIPATGYEPGSLADWLNYPTNYLDVDTNEKVIVAAGREYSAFPVIAYMHIINENYRDPNFIKKLDLTKYQEFLDGTYEFETPSGDPIDYDLCVKGIFPKAWSRDYFGRALPNTQRGMPVSIPMATAGLQPTKVPVVTGAVVQGVILSSYTVPATVFSFKNHQSDDSFEFPLVPLLVTSFQDGTSLTDVFDVTYNSMLGTVLFKGRYVASMSGTTLSLLPQYSSDGQTWYPISRLATSAILPSSTLSIPTSNYKITSYSSYADLSAVENAGSFEVLAFRLAARMQRFGEILQTSGARAVEYTLAMFGVRIPDERVQRPIFHGSFRMPVVFSEVLQTSNTTETSPQGNLAGHGITGGVNSPIHIKVIEHSFVISILNVMPRSQYREFVPAYMFRKNRLDIPVPMMQGIGDQPVKREQIFPNSKNPDEAFGFIPQYSDLWYIPSALHGHMKDTFLHWNMARAYKTEPVLSAAWRYEKPTDRSFAVRDEDQMQIQIGFVLKARRPFARNVQPGIHIV